MFEFTVARKYLVPRWKQLSVSIISLISIFVIALVVWLLLVFFSFTHGLEKGWIQKLTSLTAPVRVVPTEEYYNSYYYRIDSISAESGYSPKTIGEKLQALSSDPYNPEMDEEPPVFWPEPYRDAKGNLIDLVKEAFSAIENVEGVHAHDYEVTASNLKLKLLRHTGPVPTQAVMNQAAYIGSLDPNNKDLLRTLIDFSTEDLENLFHMQGIASETIQEDMNDTYRYLDKSAMTSRLISFFDLVSVTKLKTPKQGWRIPSNHLPKSGKIQGLAFYDGPQISRIILPQKVKKLAAVQKQLKQNGINFEAITLDLSEELDPYIPLIIEDDVEINAEVIREGIGQALRPNEVAFNLSYEIQGVQLNGVSPLSSLKFAQAHPLSSDGDISFWLNTKDGKLSLGHDSLFGDGVLLPKTFREAGVRLGDRGYLSYYTPTASTLQEQRQPIYIAGFYDPGIIPIGGKFILANEDLTALIRASHDTEEASTTNGINVRFEQVAQAENVKEQIIKNLEQRGVAQFWDVQTFREYDFTKPLLNQLQSDKTLLSIISLIIILVACSNIISMLVILVNDKKVEIGIMRAMGATSTSIAAIFGFCGMIMGILGSIVGTLAALFTLGHIDGLVALLSQIQGHNAFNPMFYGDSLPNELSFDALVFVILVTAGISVIAGIVPAVKASLMRPAEILRSE